MSAAAHEYLVSLANAGVRRGGRWLVRGVDLAVRPGEIVTLVGPNGSGKSTTARLALGIVAADEGTARRRAGLRVGYVPQKIAIDWTLPLTVGRFMRLTARVTRETAMAALEQTGAGRLWDAQLRSLSGGELQRTMLARAIAVQPDILVLDEPVQGVDFSGETAIYQLISAIRDASGCGVLLISHDLHIVMAATDHVICLNGHVCCHGPPRIVAENPEYRRLFGDRAAATLAVYEHHHDHTHLPDGRVRYADGAVVDHPHDHADDHSVPGSNDGAESGEATRAGADSA